MHTATPSSALGKFLFLTPATLNAVGLEALDSMGGLLSPRDAAEVPLRGQLRWPSGLS